MPNSIYTDEMQALISWLKSERKRHKLSMRALAQRMDKPHSYIQKIEQGERRLDVVEYVWYCNTLGVNSQRGLDLINTEIQSQVVKKA